MRSHARLIHCLLSIGASIIDAAAQSTGSELRPELGIYIQQGPFVRLEFVDEIFYDTRYGQWTPNRYGAGVQISAGSHMVLEPYYFRQNGSHSNPPHLNVFAFTWSLYF
jgi:hypothetical protein